MLSLKDGEKFARRGYWGDVVNSPYLSYGIESEEKSLFKKNNDIYVKVCSVKFCFCIGQRLKQRSQLM